MALQLVAELLGEAIAGAVRAHRERLSEKARRFLDWLRRAAEPPAGLRLRSSDGSSYSGVALLERSEVILLLAVRHAPGLAPAAPPRPPVVTPPPRHWSPYQAELDPDGPWDRDGDPYRR